MKLKKDRILQIPKMKELGMTDWQIAEKFEVHENAIKYWKRRLEKEKGIKFRKSSGRKPIKL